MRLLLLLLAAVLVASPGSSVHADTQVRRAPLLNNDVLSDYLNQVAYGVVPDLCLQRNRDNQPQRKVCEKFQYDAVARINDFVGDPQNPHGAYTYERCSKKWLNQRRADFVQLARCMGVTSS